MSKLAALKLHDETCRYVERVQEVLGQTLTPEQWEQVVTKVYSEMAFLLRDADKWMRTPK